MSTQLLLLTPRQVATVLSLPEAKVRELIERGDLVSVVIDGEVRISNDSIREFIEAGGTTGNTSEGSYRFVLKIAERDRVHRAKGEHRTAKRSALLSGALALAKVLVAHVADIDPDEDRQKKIARTLDVCISRFRESIQEINRILKV